jgi:hypothetical protein
VSQPRQPWIKKPKLLRSNPHRLSLIRGGVDPACVLVDDEDIYVGYRRPQLVREVDWSDPDTPLPEHIVNRLALAREMALKAYREKRT